MNLRNSLAYIFRQTQADNILATEAGSDESDRVLYELLFSMQYINFPTDHMSSLTTHSRRNLYKKNKRDLTTDGSFPKKKQSIILT